MEEQNRLNRMIRCPYGKKKVYIRSVLDGTSVKTSKPEIALRCAAMAYVGKALGGYNIVSKDYVESVCCGDYPQCETYQELLRRQRR